jgi:steroid 5-alpha-reductase/3-oxo-5-alpha-steroid 4-dehydrogenase 1
MNEALFHRDAALSLMALGVLVLVSLLFIDAPYGRHLRPGWGPSLPNRLGWILMESPTLAVFLPVYFSGENAEGTVPLVLLFLWLSHYVHRTLIYPFRLNRNGKRVPLLVAFLGFLFNTVNAYLIARFLSHLGDYQLGWLRDPRFLCGLLLFGLGYFINRRADRTLLRLRSAGSGDYKIPRGGLFEFVSCPNYFGEIIQWFGFALATWSLPGLAFAWYSAANLVPRALSHHRYYRREFVDYPVKRKALIPFML